MGHVIQKFIDWIQGRKLWKRVPLIYTIVWTDLNNREEDILYDVYIYDDNTFRIKIMTSGYAKMYKMGQRHLPKVVVQAYELVEKKKEAEKNGD